MYVQLPVWSGTKGSWMLSYKPQCSRYAVSEPTQDTVQKVAPRVTREDPWPRRVLPCPTAQFSTHALLYPRASNTDFYPWRRKAGTGLWEVNGSGVRSGMQTSVTFGGCGNLDKSLTAQGPSVLLCGSQTETLADFSTSQDCHHPQRRCVWNFHTKNARNSITGKWKLFLNVVNYHAHHDYLRKKQLPQRSWNADKEPNNLVHVWKWLNS
jgi:hypothetical protein